MDEMGSGLTELREVGKRRAVAGDDVAEAPRPRRLLCGASDGEIGADAPEWVERLVLSSVETARERRDGDDEGNPEREPEDGEDRPASSAEQLAAQVPKVEHALERTRHA